MSAVQPADAEDHHEEARFVAEKIAHGDLLQETETFPHWRHALEQIALAGFRRFWPDELGGALGEGAAPRRSR